MEPWPCMAHLPPSWHPPGLSAFGQVTRVLVFPFSSPFLGLLLSLHCDSASPLPPASSRDLFSSLPYCFPKHQRTGSAKSPPGQESRRKGCEHSHVCMCSLARSSPKPKASISPCQLLVPEGGNTFSSWLQGFFQAS